MTCRACRRGDPPAEPLSDEGGGLYEGTWLVEPAVADLLGRALLFAAGEEYGGVSVESFEEDERWRLAEAGADLRRKAASHEGSSHTEQSDGE